MEAENRSVIVRGIVSSGIGEGRKFTSLPWFERQVEENLGFKPYPGTLNLIVCEGCESLERILLDNRLGYRIVSENGYFPGVIYRAIVASSFPGGIVRPCVPKYPINLIEVIASVCLRRALNLKDGDKIEVEIFFK
ncbi:MAG: DUF120 domain-containing protein [Candidatus Bathyarchaeia archaeon]